MNVVNVTLQTITITRNGARRGKNKKMDLKKEGLRVYGINEHQIRTSACLVNTIMKFR
jgi:hypothetical protein